MSSIKIQDIEMKREINSDDQGNLNLSLQIVAKLYEYQFKTKTQMASVQLF